MLCESLKGYLLYDSNYKILLRRENDKESKWPITTRLGGGEGKGVK